jgi:5-formyltetrahydrofolate cyclo-ligase
MGMTAKPDLRRHMRRLRLALARDNPDAASQLADLIPDHRLRHSVVGGYAAVGGEIDPRPAMRRLAAAGARLALPVVRDVGAGFDFHAWREGDRLSPDALGVPSPLPTSERLHPDLILAPLLAFDRRGGRLGQGGGYFDRAIADLRARGPLIVMGLAFAGQEVGEVPLEPHDARLDAVLTERGYIEVGPIRRTP